MNSKPNNKTNKPLTFEEILRSEHYRLVEAIEHGCSDKELLESIKNELYEATGWRWIDQAYTFGGERRRRAEKARKNS